MLDFYPLSFIFFVYFLFLHSELRWLIKDKVNSVCSRTYLRKHCKGFVNKLFYTPVKDRCNLGSLYILNKLMIYGVVAIMLLSLCFGWISFIQVPLKWVMSTVITILTGVALIAQPRSTREMYINRGSKPGKLSSELYIGFWTIYYEAIAICALVGWYYLV